MKDKNKKYLRIVNNVSMNGVIPHIFLPRDLPHEEQANIVQEEQNLLEILEYVFSATTNSSVCLAEICPKTHKLLQRWVVAQKILSSAFVDPVSLKDVIPRDMGAGEMIALYIRSQNAGVFLSVPTESSKNADKLILSSFKASLGSTEVMSNIGDRTVGIPQQSIWVSKTELLQSNEFARQLCILNQTQIGRMMPEMFKAGHQFANVRDVAHPQMITDWATLTLSDADSEVADFEFPKIQKTVRDDVRWKNALIPFRRSGLWFTAKAALQTSFIRETGEKTGTLLYKTFMIQVMDYVLDCHHSTLATEMYTTMQMMPKIARRMEKLQVQMKTVEVVDEGVLKIIHSITDTTVSHLKNIQAALSHEWSKYSLSRFPRVEKMLLSKNQLQNDLTHQLVALTNEIDQRTSAELPNDHSGTRIPKPNCPFRIDTSSLVFPAVPSTSGYVLDFELREVEEWILLNIHKYSEITEYEGGISKTIRSFIKGYFQKAKAQYAGDPVAIGRMTRAILKCIKVLDEIATREHPILQEHKTGIDMEMFGVLLAPLREDMQVIHELETYFRQRDSCARFNSFMEEYEPSNNSVSVRFAGKSQEMLLLRNQILEQAEMDIMQKKMEVRRVREECEDLRRKIRNLSCEYKYDSYYQRNNHSDGCNKCSLESTLKTRLFSVRRYERPLPQSLNQQYAIVFELLVPASVACLRDMLFFFRYNVCSAAVESKFDRKIHCIWRIGNFNRKHNEIVSLASTLKSSLEVYSGQQNPNVDSDESEFILNNGMNTIVKASVTASNESIKKQSTFQIQSKNKAYATMQWTLNSTSHTSNQVLAKQNNCHKDMSLAEFYRFGSLRAGHRLQYRNLFMSFASKKLSLKSEAVLQLVCQAMWETGNQNLASPDILRECHVDLTGTEFAHDALQLLEEMVAENSENWSEPFVQLNIIAFTSRICELTTDSSVKEKAVEVLKKCCRVCRVWTEDIKKIIGEAYDAPEENKKQLKFKLIDASIALAMTFFVGKENLGLVMQNSEDTLNWLIGMSTLYDEVFRDFASIEPQLSPTRRCLLRCILSTAALVEKTVVPLIQNDFRLLEDFIKSRWPACDDFYSDKKRLRGPLRQVFECDQVMSKEDTMHTVHVDVILGKFFVDGSPVGKLPEEIIQSKLYQRVFQAADFQVQRDKLGVYTSTFIYNGCVYTFYIPASGEVIIKELKQKDGVGSSIKLELISHTIFDNQVPVHFVNNFSHWWDRNTKQIHFRMKDFQDPKFKEAPEYTLHLKDGLNVITENISGRKLIYINSRSCKRLTEVLHRIESVEHMHIWVEAKYPVEVELVRFNLKFLLKEGDLHSHEYPGYKLSQNQNVGTLIGLSSLLVLEGPQISELILPSKLVIVPHGGIKTLEDTYHRVTMISSSSRSPPFLAFEVDERLKTLKAGRNQSAWFFLAALHATTSSPLPDIFTGLTGTEMALHILQSARSYSSKPYDAESLKTLTFVSELSPKRSFYPEHLKCMESVSWPMNLSPLVSHDAYTFIVQKLLSNTQMATSCTKWDGKDLQLRHYWRHMLCANDSMKIADFFFPEFLKTQPATSKVENLPVFKAEVPNRLVAHFNNHTDNSFNVQSVTTSPIKSLLIKSSPLRGLKPEYLKEFPLSSVDSWIDMDIRENWINLYNVALAVKNNGWQNQWKLLISLLAFSQQGYDLLLLLQAVAKNPESFPPPLYYANYDQPTSTYSENDVKSILRRNTISFPESERSYSTYKDYQAAERRYDNGVSDAVETEAKQVTSQWPCETYQYSYNCSKINMREAKTQINARLFEWYQNLELTKFIDLVQEAHQNLLFKSKPIPTLQGFVFQPNLLTITPKFVLNYEEMIKSFAMKNTQTSEIYRTGTVSGTCDCKAVHSNSAAVKKCKEISLRQIQTTAETLLGAFKKLAVPEDSVGAQVASGLYPRMVPLVMLKILLRSSNDPRVKCVQDYLGAVAVLWTLEQRYVRSLTYLSRGPSMQVALERELETMGYENWSPREYPGWVLLQLESNMMIRPIQVKVAKEMMSPKSGKNSVMQLNMGEGKSCLIVPMLAVALADGKQLCSITVLKSIFETNFNSLVHTLGGLLGQRVITVPCRRDLPIEQNTSEILELYKSTMAYRGVVVTLPEFRLSFQLKGYENAYQTERIREATNMLEIQRWLNTYVRDILDESDEILSVKYQLVYTMGSQVHVAGGNIRWEMAQKLLKLVPSRMKSLLEEFGNSFVEIDRTQTQECFGHCRLLNKKCYNTLVDNLAEDFLNGKIFSSFPHLKETERYNVKTFLTGLSATNNKPMSQEEYAAALKIFEDSPDNLELMLILAGYLRYEVLCVALSKRWKVNYGVKKDGHRKMAVPFKAKDVASERTEFGHPDMAIILTQLSYYYSGLSDEQLLQCFEFLSLKQQQLNPVDLYDSWLNTIPTEKIHDSVKSYGGLNLDNFKQRTKYLFPMLRKAMVVIDFWLSKFVFPRESKQFPGKMTCTAWDLCSQNQRLLTTGFSGTNDSSDLLPLPMSQNDLQELQNTNESLEKVLLQEENRGYKSLPPAGKESITMSAFILKSLHEEEIRVLLDCGALMLEMSNEEVAKKWLQIDSKIEGVVYFNSKNSLTVKMRGSRTSDCPLELSPFRERLDTCAVYLDDEHTRGTDLKFPRGSRACVTLGAGITRDKLVQACMRMRMLGNGHSVTFWASHEAHSKISAHQADTSSPTSCDVLYWVKSNSREFVENGLVYWAASAVNYTRKLSAEKMTNFGDPKMQQLGALCVEKEVLLLKDMYGQMRSQEKFVDIIPIWFEALRRSLCILLESEYAVLLKNISEQVVARCQKLIPEKLHFSQLLDEEQEKELENELEEEKEPDPPREATPAQHTLEPFVRECIKLGQLDLVSEYFGELVKSVPKSFEHTELANSCDVQSSGWGDKIFATSDFITTIIRKNEKENVDDFLRSPAWVVSLQNNSTSCLLLLISPYEANELIPEFRSRHLKSTLHLYIPRLLSGQKDTLIDKSALCLPQVAVGCALSHELLAPLNLFSGALYFNSREEEEAFAGFLQIIPREGRTPEQNKAFDEGQIALNGFLTHDYRKDLLRSSKSSSFKKNPDTLVKEILRMRNQGTIPEESHVKKLAVDGVSSFRK